MERYSINKGRVDESWQKGKILLVCVVRSHVCSYLRRCWNVRQVSKTSACPSVLCSHTPFRCLYPDVRSCAQHAHTHISTCILKGKCCHVARGRNRDLQIYQTRPTNALKVSTAQWSNVGSSKGQSSSFPPRASTSRVHI